MALISGWYARIKTHTLEVFLDANKLNSVGKHELLLFSYSIVSEISRFCEFQYKT